MLGKLCRSMIHRFGRQPAAACNGRRLPKISLGHFGESYNTKSFERHRIFLFSLSEVAFWSGISSAIRTGRVARLCRSWNDFEMIVGICRKATNNKPGEPFPPEGFIEY